MPAYNTRAFRRPLLVLYASHVCDCPRARTTRLHVTPLPHLPLFLHLFSAIQIRRRTYDVPSAYYVNVDYT